MDKKFLQTLDTVGKRLRYWRERRGQKNQGQFAKKLKIAQASLSELENKDKGEPAASTLLRACKELGLEPWYLLFGEGPPERMQFNDLSVVERYMILMYRALDEETRAEIESRINEAYNRTHPEPSAVNPFPSAGLPPLTFQPARRRINQEAKK